MKLIKDIHFPKVQAVYEPPEKKNLLKRIFGFLTYRRKWEIQEDYIVWSEHLKEYICMPNKFIFDGASVPKILYFLYSPNGILLYGAPPHDFGYRYEGLLIANEKTHDLSFRPFSKHELDTIFNNLCSEESGLQIASKAATLVLSIAGYIGWYGNRRKNNVLIVDFPDLFRG